MRNEEIVNEIRKFILNDTTQDQKGKYSIFFLQVVPNFESLCMLNLEYLWKSGK